MERIGKLYFEFSAALFDSKFSISDMIEILGHSGAVNFFDKNKNKTNDPKKVTHYFLINRRGVVQALTAHF